MANDYTCYVPKEWSGHSEKFLKDIIKNKAVDQWRHYKKMEGTTIRLENVTAKFNYHGISPWMRKAEDKNTRPHANEYYGIKMNCILCSKNCRNFGHRVCSYD